LVLSVSSTITLVLTCALLYFDYREELKGMEANFKLIETTYLGGFASALWNFDQGLMEVLAAGVLKVPGVIGVEIREKDRVTLKVGEPGDRHAVDQSFDLLFKRNAEDPGTDVGTARVWMDLDAVYFRVWQKAGTILVSQFVKTFLVSIFILLVLKIILTQHLSRMKTHLLNFADLRKDYEPLQLRRSNKYQDEIRSLQDSINHMQSLAQKNFRELAELNSNLEKTVEDRSQIISQQQQQLLLASKLSALGEMAGGIAHEINSPLAIISLLAEQSKKTPGIDPKVIEIQNKILSTVNRIGKITSGMRFLARDSSNEQLTKVSAKSLLEETLAFCSFKLASTGVDLRVEAEDDAMIPCRPVQISQVLMNLIGNAIDSIENLPEKWIRISFEKTETQFRILVTDSGGGIPDEIAEKILMPFFTTKEVGKGTGLGLSISHTIMSSHQGRLYYNKQSKNTQFVIELPLVAELNKSAA
jgi:C4-dicarboxylate-specific signal transduction histidine kinase